MRTRRMLTSLLVSTTVFGAALSPAPVHAQDHGLDPDGADNPGNTDTRRAPSGFSEQGWLNALMPSVNPQFDNPMFPNGREGMPKAQIDMHPEEIERLKHWMGVNGDTVRQINAYSPSMGRWIPLVWLPAPDTSTPRPVVYALGGADGGYTDQHWLNRSDLPELAREGNYHVVIPALGRHSAYTDWVEELPEQGGKQMWETFLTYELPEALEAEIGGDGQRSLIGMSMSGGTALNYAAHQPGFYSSVASLSGCAANNTWWGRYGLNRTIEGGGGNADMMWGPMNSPLSRYNDAVLNAERLKDQENLYVYSATGLMGALDFFGDWAPANSNQKKDRWSSGFSIEAASNLCAHQLKVRTDSLGITDIAYDFPMAGTHSWDAWNTALHTFWPRLQRGFGEEVVVPDVPSLGSSDLGSSDPATGVSTSSELAAGSSALGSSDGSSDDDAASGSAALGFLAGSSMALGNFSNSLLQMIFTLFNLLFGWISRATFSG